MTPQTAVAPASTQDATGKRAHTPDARIHTLNLVAHRTQQPAPAPAVRDPLPSPTSVSCTSDSNQDPPPAYRSVSSASDSTISTTTTTSVNLHHYTLVQHDAPKTASIATETSPKTGPHRLHSRQLQGSRSPTTRYGLSGAAAHPSEARAGSPAKTPTSRHAATQNPATTQDHRRGATQTCHHTTARNRYQTQALDKARRRADSANPAPRVRPLRPPAPAIQGPAAANPALRPPAIADAAATIFRAERATAGARRTPSQPHPKSATLVHRPSRTGPEHRQGQQAASRPPFQLRCLPASRRCPVTAANMDPNPTPMQSISICPRVSVCPRPARCPRTRTAQNYKCSPRSTTAASPHDPSTRTHAHAHATAEGQ